MNLSNSIFEVYGVKIPTGQGDGRYRVFKIDQLRNGYFLNLSKNACFGSIIDKECFVLNEFGLFRHETEHKDSKEIRKEWLVWEIARGMLERGERLDRNDKERLSLAVKRLEEWL